MREVDPSPAEVPNAVETLAHRLNRLFETCHPADRGPYTNAEVARIINEKAREKGDKSGEISETYIGYLRKGKRDNPTKRHLESLAEFFGVPARYFFDDGDGERVREDLALLHALKGVGARQVALRTVASLDEDALDALVPVLKHLGNAHGTRGRMRPRTGRAPGSPTDTPPAS
ncbi:helix-turn-helix transcriptional regulator [Streptomyces sp. NPDC002055]|uniref:helix-turn-helix transcriptional regulator n=1 Tax=Streptomyces sp. NPDC002055 TaxID=3154534 RepID=UPI00331FEE12